MAELPGLAVGSRRTSERELLHAPKAMRESLAFFCGGGRKAGQFYLGIEREDTGQAAGYKSKGGKGHGQLGYP